MSMLETLNEAIEEKSSVYHEFLLQYKKGQKVIYGFVEGKDDPIFYTGCIEHYLLDGWDLKLLPAGGKKNVLEIHSAIDWRRFKKKQICFFIDRDLSALIPEKVVLKSNIYTTTGYSIENYVVQSSVCVRSLREVYGLSDVPEKEMKVVQSLFETQREKFYLLMIPVMSTILQWRTTSKKANLNNVNLNKLFKVDCGRLEELDAEKSIEILHGQCDVHLPDDFDITNEVKIFSPASVYRKFVRGKYLLWFLVRFCNSIHKESVKTFPSIRKRPRNKVVVSDSNGMCVFGNRGRTPNKLKKFIEENYLSHMSK